MSRSLGRPLAALTLVAVLALVGCTVEQPAPAPSGASGTTATTAAPSTTAATAAPVAFVPGGTAQQNLAFFTQVVTSVWGGPDQVAGRAYVDALTAAGFDKSAMQVTPDQSTIGNAAESIEFSVRLGDDCLVGQVGPSIGNPVTTVLPGLASGGCLIGQTRAIDW
ncbi:MULTISPECIES: hypothetical protein [Microbacterium]|uniref:DUF6993 domain-containing protein n=1 Tax=Microbacterium TaxID=33882 RepID=UPI0027853B3F|nr:MULTISPECIES: hypothetical protein [Microbacterium]MDQ1084051.1 hypothetical protein [Microbacterium sp. SORGH_AS_0344]MDQ1170670.1 hypothetical protein [Microbacterium proteolyticum]